MQHRTSQIHPAHQGHQNKGRCTEKHRRPVTKAHVLNGGALEVSGAGHDDADDDSKKAERRSKNLNDENLDEEGRVDGIRERTAAAHDSHADPAHPRHSITGTWYVTMHPMCVQTGTLHSALARAADSQGLSLGRHRTAAEQGLVPCLHNDTSHATQDSVSAGWLNKRILARHKQTTISTGAGM